jgi:hypothetical protein
MAYSSKSIAQDDGAFTEDFSSLSDALVRISGENTIGIGFIISMEGAQYIVTNANVVSGHTKLSFTSLSGKEIQPKKIELSATRDLARFMVTGQKALKMQPAEKGSSIAVLEYDRSSTITPHQGSCDGVGKDMIEVTAPFESQSNGSPLLNTELQVCGTANHMIYYKMQDNSWEGTPRRFAYRLNDAHWYSPNWKHYNRTYGKSLREVDEFRSVLYSVANDWIQNPKCEIETTASLGLEFDRWVKQHNGMISDLSKKRSRNDNGSANKTMIKRFQASCQALIGICDAKAKQLLFLCEDKKITPYLKLQFKWRALELKKFTGAIAAHEKAHANDRWV